MLLSHELPPLLLLLLLLPLQIQQAEAGDSSSSSSSSASSMHIRRRRRKAVARAAAGFNSSSSSSSSVLYGLYNRPRIAVRRRYKQHTRPAFGSTSSTTASQQVAVAVLPAAAAAPLPAGLPPGRDNSSSSRDDGWQALWGQPPLPLAIADAKAVYGQQHSINEKNWMPFVWQVGI
jgi:hypothetical protein